MVVTAFASRNGIAEADRTLRRLRRILEAIETDFAAQPGGLSARRQQALSELNAALDGTDHEGRRRRGGSRQRSVGGSVVAFRHSAYRPFISPR
jgi:hypothetical protein